MARDQITAVTRVQRLLAMLQWAAQHPDGVTYEDLRRRFDLGDKGLVRELEMAAMIGADSVNYDEMPFEVILEEDRVFVRLFSFGRPMRLTPAEGLSLVASAHALVDHDDEGPLARALAKLALLLGVEPGQAVDVHLDPEGGPTGRFLRDAVDRGRRVRFRYWTYGRDVVASREVDPWAVFAAEGAWYLAGGDVSTGEERRFRLDRMEEVELLDVEATPAPRHVDTSLDLGDGWPEVVLDLSTDARWVLDTLPVVSAVPGDDGRLTVTLAIAGPAWLERLLLRLGPEARVVSIDERLGGPDVGARAARRILARYRG